MATILIVEDEIQVLFLAEAVLREAGHETRSAGTGAEARALIATGEPIDLLFVDLTLFDEWEAGLELAKGAAIARPGLPVLYTTGRGVTDGMIALFVEPNGYLG